MSTLQATAAMKLRQVVEAIFPVAAKNVQLMDVELSPEFVPLEHAGHSWSDQVDTCYHWVWGFSHTEGFKLIAGNSRTNYSGEHCALYKLVGEHAEGLCAREYRYSVNGDMQESEGQQLLDISGVDRYTFFLVFESGTMNQGSESYETWSLYKAPNFYEVWSRIEADDIARWSEWLQK